MSGFVRVNIEARTEDIRFMVETGENVSGAAKRLGITVDAVEKWCQNNGMRTELDALRLREPGAGNLTSEHARQAAKARWSA